MRHLILAALLAVGVPASSWAQPLPTPPEDATRLIACDRASRLTALGLLTTEPGVVREDRPAAFLLDAGRVVWSRWTPGDTDVVRTEGEAGDGAAPAELARVDLSAAGCWAWDRDSTVVTHLQDDEQTTITWLPTPQGRRATGVQLDDLRRVAKAKGGAPRTAWEPHLVIRYNLEKAPTKPSLKFNQMTVVDHALGAALTCAPWSAGVTAALGGDGWVVHCPSTKPGAAIKQQVAEAKAAGTEPSRDGAGWDLGAPYMLRHLTVGAGGWFAATAAELTDGGASAQPWWPDDAGAERPGVVIVSEGSVVHASADGEQVRTALRVASAEEMHRSMGNSRMLGSVRISDPMPAPPSRVIGGMLGSSVPASARCEGEDPGACFEAGRALVRGDEAALQRANGYFERGCEGGFGRSCWALAEHHRLGLGVTVDADRARALYERACAAGDAEGACAAVAIVQVKAGELTARDDAFVKLLRRACSEDPSSCLNGSEAELARGEVAWAQWSAAQATRFRLPAGHRLVQALLVLRWCDTDACYGAAGEAWDALSDEPLEWSWDDYLATLPDITHGDAHAALIRASASPERGPDADAAFHAALDALRTARGGDEGPARAHGVRVRVAGTFTSPPELSATERCPTRVRIDEAGEPVEIDVSACATRVQDGARTGLRESRWEPVVGANGEAVPAWVWTNLVFHPPGD